MRRWQLENFSLMQLGKIYRNHFMTIKLIINQLLKLDKFSTPLKKILSIRNDLVSYALYFLFHLQSGGLFYFIYCTVREIRLIITINNYNNNKVVVHTMQPGKSQSQIIQIPVQKNQEQFQLKKSSYQIQNVPKKLTCIQIFQDTLYLGTRQSKLFIYRIDGNTLVDQKVLIPHCQIVSTVAVYQRYFVTVAESDDQVPMSVWDTKTNMFITALKSHQSQVSRAIFLTQPGWLVTSSWDCTVKIWDLRNILEWEEKIKTINSEYPVLTVSQVRDDIIAFGGDDCYINIWNWKSMQFLGKYFGHAGSVTLIFSDPNFIITAGGDHRLKQWQFNILGKLPSNNESSQLQKKEQQKKYIRVIKQIKKTYDSSIFLVRISSNEIFLLDRHGNRFLHRFGKEFISCANNFKYNENITGMINYNGRIFVVTTKGELLAFEIERKMESLEIKL